MPRKIRLKCPACQTVIESSVEEELRISLECTACRKQFTAKVPPRADAMVSAQVVQPIPTVAAKPVVSKPVVSKPVASRPVAQPVRAQPVPAKPPAKPTAKPTARPVAAAPVAPSQPTWDDPLDFNVPVPLAPAYQPIKRRKPVNIKPFLMAGGGVVGLVLVLMLALFGWRWIANTDWSTFSLVPDSHDRLMADWFEKSERLAELNLKSLSEDAPDIETSKRRIVDSLRFGETILVRSVRLGKGSLEQKAAFEQKQTALNEKMRPIMEAKLAEMRASGKTPPSGMRNEELLEDLPNLEEYMLMATAGDYYLRHGMFDLPPPSNEVEKTYYDEADIVHEFLKQLANVRTTSQSRAAAQRIDALSEKMLLLALQRAKLPPNQFERVPREYAEKDRAFNAAQRALAVRALRDAAADEMLKDAASTFIIARECLLDAAAGKSDVALRSRMALAKEAFAKSSEQPPGGLFAELKKIQSSSRELVEKPQRDRAPLPERDPVAVKPTAPASTNSVAQNAEKPASSPAAVAQPAPETQPAPTDSQVTQTPPNAAPSGSLRPGMIGPPGGFRPGGFGPGGFPPDMPNGPPPGFQGNGSGFPGSQNPFGPSMPDNGSPTFAPGESVTIIIEQNSSDRNELVKRLARQLNSDNYSMNAFNSTCTLKFKYADKLDNVVKLIDFGKVISIDEATRVIRVQDQ